MKKFGFAFFIFLGMSFFSSCISQELQNMYAVVAPQKKVEVKVIRGKINVSGIMNYNPNNEDVFYSGVTSDYQIQTNRTPGGVFSENEKFTQKIKYGYEFIRAEGSIPRRSASK